MPSNLDRFKKDLEKLMTLGDKLLISMQRELLSAEEFKKQVEDGFGKDKDKASTFIKNLPDFKVVYEAWYSEAAMLIRQLLPHRINDFVGYYERPKNRKTTDCVTYVIQDFMQGLVVTHGYETKTGPAAALPKYRQQLAILEAAKSRFESSLFEIRQLVQAELFDSEVETARELLKKKFLRAAGAVAGVVLEKHLLQVCEDHKIMVKKKNPGISDLNDLLKEESIIDLPQWRFISLLGDIRNLCAHNKEQEPTLAEVTDLIDGAAKVLKTVL
jgi:hypothetical protein